ncbi:unnamed protein product [Vitrella brassicaformis CCMP3155]|uniref:Uncharacterized protein n=2 Tax=Vitrella brassicaformis (strain CCMP3155) TaxID=1169540 RepID=A0A0G4GZN9_VITBC|nr:unnamed protein product [Vitrella brassicaformis CCMP3155]|eukprot:CEM36695.1 unnamed protein product [Vitrella brassicaformis CCMP3155]
MLGFEESALLRDTALDKHVPISVQQTKLEELLTHEQEIEDKPITAEYTKEKREEELKQIHKQQEKLRASIQAAKRLHILLVCACKDSSTKYILEQYEAGVKDTYDEFDGVLAFKRLKAKRESNPVFAELSAQHEFDAFIWDLTKSALVNNGEFKRLAGKLPISEKIIKSDVTLDDAMERVRKLETAAAMIGASPGQDASIGVGAAVAPMDVDEGAGAADGGESINCKYCLNDGHLHWDCKRLTHDKKMYSITLFPSSHRMKRAAELLKSHLDEVERKEKVRVIKDNNKGKNNKYNKGHGGGVRRDRNRRHETPRDDQRNAVRHRRDRSLTPVQGREEEHTHVHALKRGSTERCTHDWMAARSENPRVKW